MATFKDYLKDRPELEEEYTAWLKEQGKDAEPDWEAFHKEHSDSPAAAPSDLLDVHAKIASGLLGGVVGGVTDTVGGLTGGLLGGEKSEKSQQ